MRRPAQTRGVPVSTHSPRASHAQSFTSKKGLSDFPVCCRFANLHGARHEISMNWLAVPGGSSTPTPLPARGLQPPLIRRSPHKQTAGATAGMATDLNRQLMRPASVPISGRCPEGVRLDVQEGVQDLSRRVSRRVSRRRTAWRSGGGERRRRIRGGLPRKPERARRLRLNVM